MKLKAHDRALHGCPLRTRKTRTFGGGLSKYRESKPVGNHAATNRVPKDRHFSERSWMRLISCTTPQAVEDRDALRSAGFPIEGPFVVADRLGMQTEHEAGRVHASPIEHVPVSVALQRLA